MNILRHRPICNGGNTIGVHRDTFRGDDEAQKRERGSMKFTLLEFASQPQIAQACQNLLDIGDMLFKSVRKDKNIIQVNDTEEV
jgi:hypothetical protein